MTRQAGPMTKYDIRVYYRPDSFDVVAQHRDLTAREIDILNLAGGWGIYVYDDSIPAVGMVSATKAVYAGNFVMQASSQTSPKFRRMGVATKLYAEASRIAQEEYGIPLASDLSRSEAAENFWQKQVRVGLADKIKLLPEEQYHGVSDVYVMKIPMVDQHQVARLRYVKEKP